MNSSKYWGGHRVYIAGGVRVTINWCWPSGQQFGDVWWIKICVYPTI
jgi:hypothetical protein